MKRKDILMKIKASAEKEMPEVFDKINLDKIVVEDKPERIKAGFNFRRAISVAMTSFVIIISAFLIYNFSIAPNISNATPLENENEIIGFQTVSAASMLDIGSLTDMSFTADSDSFMVLSTAVSSDDEVDEQMDIINSYLNMMETVLGKEDYLSYQEIASDNPDYANEIQFKSMDLNGNLIQYQIYYNKELSGDNYQINGIMVYNTETYNFSGYIDRNNVKTNSEFTAYLDGQNYVKVKNISTQSAQMFQYQIVQNGQIFNQSDVSISSQNNSLQAKVVTKNMGADITLTITRGKTDDNSEGFNVGYTIRNQNLEKNGNIQVNLEKNNSTGEYMYQYRYNSQSENGRRKGKGISPVNSDDFSQNNMTTNDQSTNTSGTNPTTDTQPGSNDATSNTDPGKNASDNNPNITDQGSDQGIRPGYNRIMMIDI